MKTILLPTDFSEHAFYALKVAASIAKKINAELKIIHVNNSTPAEFSDNYYYREFYNQLKTETEQKLNELVDLDFLKGIKVSKQIVINMLLWELVKDKKYKDVDLIVIGSHGKSGYQKAFLGSNTEKIIRMADAPVLTIKNDHDDFSIKSMIFASDFNEESYTFFDKIKFFIDLYQAHINLLKVITPKNFEPTPVSKKLMADFVKKFELKNYTANIFNAVNIEKGISDFAEEINTDLIAIETHGRTGISYLINGSIAEDIATHVARPVLSVKMEETFGYISKIRNYTKNYENWGAE